MRKLIIKNFLFDWKFQSNLPLLLILLFIGYTPPILVTNVLAGIWFIAIMILLLIIGVILYSNDKYSFGVSATRSIVFIYPTLMITGTLLLKYPDKNYIGVVGVVITILLYLLPKIVALKPVQWDELDASQKHQLGTLYKQGMNRSGNIHMNTLDWEQWSILNAYYFNKYKHLNK